MKHGILICGLVVVNWDLNPVAKPPPPGHRKMLHTAACHHWPRLPPLATGIRIEIF